MLGCALHDEGNCQGRLEWHHVLPKQRLRQQFRYGASWQKPHRPVGANDIIDRITQPQILADERNRVWLCARHHELLTNHRIYLTEIPESVKDFARDYGLEGWLERYTQVEATRLVGLENARRRTAPSEYEGGEG